LRDFTFSRFGAVPACDRQTERRMDRWTHDDSIYRACIASRGKKLDPNHILGIGKTMLFQFLKVLIDTGEY